MHSELASTDRGLAEAVALHVISIQCKPGGAGCSFFFLDNTHLKVLCGDSKIAHSLL